MIYRNSMLKTDLIQETYHLLKKERLITTKAEFSTQWLNKSSRYYSMLRSSKRDISVEAMATLAARLEVAAQRLQVHRLSSDDKTNQAIEFLAWRVTMAIRDRVLGSS